MAGAATEIERQRAEGQSAVKASIKEAAAGIDKAVRGATDAMAEKLTEALTKAMNERSADMVQAIVELRREVLEKLGAAVAPMAWEMNFTRGQDRRITSPVSFTPKGKK
jgi:hypothetical protein